MPRDRRRDDDEDEDDRPARKRRRVEDDDDEEPRPKRKPRVVDEDEDEPPRRVRPRVVDEDDEDEEEERPRRRKKKRKPAGMNKGLLFGLIGGGLAIVLVVVLLLVFMGGGSPKSAYNEFWTNTQKRRFDKVWDGLSEASQQKVATRMRLLAAESEQPRNPRRVGIVEYGNGIKQQAMAASGKRDDAQEPLVTDGKAFFIKMMEIAAVEEDPAQITHTVVKEEVNGNAATLTVEETQKNGQKSTRTCRMVKEGGRWKVDGR